MNKVNVKPFFFIMGLLALLVVWGCKEEDKFALRFSHFLHIEEIELTCMDCHSQATKGNFGMPSHDNCVDCHSELIETKDIRKKTCGFCHQDENLYRIGEEAPPKRTSRGIFFHSEALSGLCQECHEKILAEEVKISRLMSRDDVVRVREKSHTSGRPCVECHKDLTPQTMPETHQTNWKKRHGVYANDKDYTCSICHEESTCRTCHQIEAPDSHNTLWVLNTHGIEGAWNRQNCQVCHLDDFCFGCHSETKPRSHNAQWARLHGLTAPTSFSNCKVCHQKEECQACHQVETPTSHTANWENVHCVTCHASTSLSTGCKVCHVGGISAHPQEVPPIAPINHSLVASNSCFLVGGCHADGAEQITSPNHILNVSLCVICHPLP